MLQESLTLENVNHRLRSKPYTFTKDSSDAKERKRFEFRTRTKAMDFFRMSVSRLAKGMQKGVVIVDGVEYRFGRS